MIFLAQWISGMEFGGSTWQYGIPCRTNLKVQCCDSYHQLHLNALSPAELFSLMTFACWGLNFWNSCIVISPSPFFSILGRWSWKFIINCKYIGDRHHYHRQIFITCNMYHHSTAAFISMISNTWNKHAAAGSIKHYLDWNPQGCKIVESLSSLFSHTQQTYLIYIRTTSYEHILNMNTSSITSDFHHWKDPDSSLQRFAISIKLAAFNQHQLAVSSKGATKYSYKFGGSFRLKVAQISGSQLPNLFSGAFQ